MDKREGGRDEKMLWGTMPRNSVHSSVLRKIFRYLNLHTRRERGHSKKTEKRRESVRFREQTIRERINRDRVKMRGI